MTDLFERPWLLLLLPPVAAAWWLLFRYGRRSRLQGVRRSVLALRLLLFACLILALAGLKIPWGRSGSAVVFVVDLSRSLSPEEAARGKRFVNEAVSEMRADDAAGCVVVGSEAMLERIVTDRSDGGNRPVEFTGRPDPNGTNLEAGVNLALASLPEGMPGRIVLLSDGIETRGLLLAAAEACRATGVPLSAVPLGRPRMASDLRIDVLALPPVVKISETFDLRIVVRGEGSGRLRLFRDGRIHGEQPIESTGSRPLVLSAVEQIDREGLYRFRAEVLPSGDDGVPENNTAYGMVRVVGQPRVLLVGGAPDDTEPLGRALERAQMEVVYTDDPPRDLAGFLPYQLVVLANYSALRLNLRQERALESFVRDLGNGLLMVGGEESFGPGGYYQTPVERALPVSMDVKDRKYFPSVAMALVIDKSCSMGSVEEAGSKLALAREAAIMTADLLTERDQVMVIAFDSAASVVSPLHHVTDKADLFRSIGTMRSGGGTDVYPGLKAAYEVLAPAKAGARHVILLSDGMTAPSDYPGLIEKMRKAKMTVTTLAIGRDSDLATMEAIASQGEGRFYVVNDIHNIPKIFTKETILATRAFLIEEPFRARTVRLGTVLKGIELERGPNLLGYVATSLKDRAELLAETARKDPLLAVWHYGLGRSGAFTSDFKGRWAKNWLSWPSGAKLMVQLCRGLLQEGLRGSMAPRVGIDHGRLSIDLSVTSPGGRPWNFLAAEANVLDPEGDLTSVTLRQTGPGRYVGDAAVSMSGSYIVALSAAENGREAARKIVSTSLDYPEEFVRYGRDEALLQEATKRTGGAIISRPEDVFGTRGRVTESHRQAWPWLAALALLFLIVEVGVRRLLPAVGRDARPVLRRRVRGESGSSGRAGRPPASGRDNSGATGVEVGSAVGSSEAETSVTSRLLAAKRRARRRTIESPEAEKD